MSIISRVCDAMIGYYAGDARRINHFFKVYGFAKVIGELEELDDATREILELAALTHDIGIKNSERKYHSTAGTYQQTEGPPEARVLLESLGINTPVIDRVCLLIGCHHTYMDIRGIDHQILIEADFLVNAYEDNMSVDAVRHVRDSIFKTKKGIELLTACYEL